MQCEQNEYGIFRLPCFPAGFGLQALVVLTRLTHLDLGGMAAPAVARVAAGLPALSSLAIKIDLDYNGPVVNLDALNALPPCIAPVCFHVPLIEGGPCHVPMHHIPFHVIMQRCCCIA
jgi:hypothetical protein